MKTLLISTALLTAPLVGSVSAQTSTSTMSKLVSEQERQIQELKSEVGSLRSLLNLERRKNGKVALPVTTSTAKKTHTSSKSHTVKAGDTFSSISRKHGISVSSLINANPKVKPSQIAINQKLVIPQATSTAVATTTKKAKPTPSTTKASLTSSTTQTISSKGSTYKVAKGDTFYSIAKKNNISLAALSAAHPGVNTNALKIGQTIKLNKSTPQASKASKPSKATQSKKASSAYKPLPKVVKKTTPTPSKPKAKAVVKSTYTPTPKTKPTPKPAPKTESYVKQSSNVARTVPVSREMTFGAFAKQHGTSITVLNALNGLNLPSDEPMAAGSELFIPNK